MMGLPMVKLVIATKGKQSSSMLGILDCRATLAMTMIG
jgi:hypothetical protein